MKAVAIENLMFQYPSGIQALNGVTLSVNTGEKVALLGANGSGKSTLLKHLNALHLPLKGSVSIMGERVTKRNIEQIRRKVGIVFQDPDDQVFSSTVWDDVCFGPSNMGLASDEIDRRCRTALGTVGMLEHRERPPYELSYGQRKRVAIAGILAMQPDVVLLDEPMAYLDPEGQDAVHSLLDGLHYMGKTIMVATHDVNFAAMWADRIVILKNGRLLVSGDPDLLVEEKWITEAKLHYPMVARPFVMLKDIPVKKLPKTDREAARAIFDLYVCTEKSALERG